MLAAKPGLARGALLFYACVPVAEFDQPGLLMYRCRCMAWMPTHSSWMKAISMMPGAGSGKPRTVSFFYHGDQGYCRRLLASYDPVATELLTQRVLAFLAAL